MTQQKKFVLVCNEIEPRIFMLSWDFRAFKLYKFNLLAKGQPAVGLLAKNVLFIRKPLLSETIEHVNIF